MKNKHILIGITSAGSYVLLKGSIEYLIMRGYRVSLVSEYSAELSKKSADIGFDFYEIRIKREINLLSDFISFFQILLVIRKAKPDICNFGTPKISLIGVIAARLLSVSKVVYTCRGIRYYHETGFKRLLLKYFEKLTINYSHRTLFIAPSLETFVKSEFSMNSGKYLSISPGSSNGVDLAYFNPSNLIRESISANYANFISSVDNPFILVFVGRIIDRKGWRELYLAHRTLRRKHKNVLLTIVGDLEFAQISDRHLVDELQADESVFITGWVDDIRPFLSNAALLVNPSYWEGFGNVFLQAAACGIPVLAGNSLGCVDAVSNGFNGFLVNPFSPEDIANKITYFIENPHMISIMGDNGVKFASNFRSEKIWDQYIDLYELTL